MAAAAWLQLTASTTSPTLADLRPPSARAPLFTLAVFHPPYKLAPKMPSGAIVHAAVFAVGAIVGGGVATAVARKREATVISPPVVTQGIPTQAPVLDVRGGNASGILMKPPPGVVTEVDNAVLKYGHPGMFNAVFESGYSCLVASYRPCV